MVSIKRSVEMLSTSADEKTAVVVGSTCTGITDLSEHKTAAAELGLTVLEKQQESHRYLIAAKGPINETMAARAIDHYNHA